MNSPMLKFPKSTSSWAIAFLLMYVLLNALLILSVFLDPELSGEIPWLVMVFAAGFSVLFWKQAAGYWPETGLWIFGFTFLAIGIAYGVLVLVPDSGFISRLLKMLLVLLCGVALPPISYFIGRRSIGELKKDNEEDVYSSFLSTNILSRSQIFLLWCSIAILIFSIYAIPAFLRPDILGSDTPTYVFRTRVLDTYGVDAHAKIEGGLQITFPMLGAVIHRLTGLDYIDVVRLLPPILLTLICLLSGYFVFLATGSQPFALITVFFTSAWGLAPWLLSNLYDNLLVTAFGISSLICLLKTEGKYAWLFEFGQISFLLLAGISHLTLSIIFFITIFHVNFMQFYDKYLRGESKDLGRNLWKAIRAPLLAGLLVTVIWSPILNDFVLSLGFGLKTHAELGEGRDTTFSWIIEWYNFSINLPWILLGYLVSLWVIIGSNHNKGVRIIYSWSTVCFIFGIVLYPISFLNSRFLSMAPTYILIPIALGYILSVAKTDNLKVLQLIQKLPVYLILGILLCANVLLNTRLTNTLEGVPVSEYTKLEPINQYIFDNQPKQPYVFLVEDISMYSVTYSDLWRRVIRSRIADEGLTNLYIYFGTLDYLLIGEQTPLYNNKLPPIIYIDTFLNANQRWFNLLVDEGVLEEQEMTIFIIDDYNPDIFAQYEFLPTVDKIAPGILVINVPEDLGQQSVMGGDNQ